MSKHDDPSERIARMEADISWLKDQVKWLRENMVTRDRFDEFIRSERRFNWAIVTLLSAIFISLITGLFYFIPIFIK